jgi:hypothetical protein
MTICSDRLKITWAASPLLNRSQPSAAPLPGDFTTHPCLEYFSLDLASSFILQGALMIAYAAGVT